MDFRDLKYTYQQIGEVMLDVLRDEGEELDFLCDYLDYCMLRDSSDIGEYQPYCTIAHFLVEGFNRFHNTIAS